MKTCVSQRFGSPVKVRVRDALGGFLTMEGRKPPWAHGWGLSHHSSGEALVGFGGQPQVPDAVCRIFETGSVIGLTTVRLHWPVRCNVCSSCICCPNTGNSSAAAVPGILCELWEWSPGLCACKASSLPTEPSLQPKCL